jgi:hypothetical protein
MLFAPASAMLAAGLLFGLVYFRTLRWTVQLYESRRLAAPAALTLGRFAGGALFLGFAARLGPLPLLAAFLGFLLARALVLHTIRRAG